MIFLCPACKLQARYVSRVFVASAFCCVQKGRRAGAQKRKRTKQALRNGCSKSLVASSVIRDAGGKMGVWTGESKGGRCKKPFYVEAVKQRRATA
jgi:hypothetical protein